MPDNCSWYDTNADLWYEQAQHKMQKKLKMEAKHKKQTRPVKATRPDEFDLMPILTSGLERAFDEGAESPYDLRDDTIRDILTEMNDRAAQETKAIEDKRKTKIQGSIEFNDITDAIESAIPEPVRSLLQSTEKCWLAGGAIPRILLKSNADTWKNSDNDIFIHKGKLSIKHVKELSLKEVTKDTGPYASPDGRFHHKRIRSMWECDAIHSHMKSHHNPQKLNVISGDYNSLLDVLTTFDFTFLQCGFYYEKNADGAYLPRFSIMNLQTYADLMHNVIRLTPAAKSNAESLRKIGHLKGRIKKYIKRGFRDCTGLVERGLLPKYCSAFSQVRE